METAGTDLRVPDHGEGDRDVTATRQLRVDSQYRDGLEGACNVHGALVVFWALSAVTR